MINEIEESNGTVSPEKPTPFCEKLKNAREALGLERKDAAAQLRLSEKVIMMMEKDRYPADLPVTFIRGYLRSYAKLLQISDQEIRKAIEHIKPKPALVPAMPASKPFVSQANNENYFMQIFTYLIIFVMLGLVAMWWYSQTNPQVASSHEGVIAPLQEAILESNPFHSHSEIATVLTNITPILANTPIPSVENKSSGEERSPTVKTNSVATKAIKAKAVASVAKKRPLPEPEEEYIENED